MNANRFHYTRTGKEGFIVYDRLRPIQSAKRVPTEPEALQMVAKLKNDHDKREWEREKGSAGPAK